VADTEITPTEFSGWARFGAARRQIRLHMATVLPGLPRRRAVDKPTLER